MREPAWYLAMPLAVFALLSDPVDGVEVVVGAHSRNRLLQQIQEVGGATHPSGSAPTVRHVVGGACVATEEERVMNNAALINQNSQTLMSEKKTKKI